MADTNPPNQGGNAQGGAFSSQENDRAKELLKLLKQRVLEEGTYRDVLKETIKDYDRSIKALDRMNAKLETMNRGTINIKDIQRQITLNDQKRYVVSKSIEDVQKKLGEGYNLSLKRAKEFNKENDKKVDSEIEIIKVTKELEALSDKLIKKDKDAITNARNYSDLLGNSREIQNKLAEAKKKKNKEDIAQYTEELQKNKEVLKTEGALLSKEQLRFAKAADLENKLAEQIKNGQDYLQQQGDHLTEEDLMLAALLKENKLLEDQKNFNKEKLNLEKQVSRNLGISGNLVKSFADKLGVGNEVYEAMTDAARRNAEATANGGKKVNVFWVGIKKAASEAKLLWQSMSGTEKTILLVGAALSVVKSGFNLIGKAAKNTGEFLAGMSDNSSNVVRKLTSGISSLVGKIPIVGGLLSGLIDGFSAVLDLIIGVDDYIVKAGRQIGLTAGKARELNRYYQELSYNSGNVFMNSKKYLESQVELSQQLGINNQFSAQILETNRMLKDFAGLEAESRTRIAETSIITGKSSETVVKKITAQVVGLQKATGIAFNYQQIIKEAANLGGYLGLQFAKYPEKLTKALVTVKALGMDLKQLEGMADTFLDFESSISKEFEAQLLTGKNINLQRARELFLQNDLAGAAMEINKQIGSSAEFMKMNRIAADSLASALGMSRDQMGDMLRKQELYTKLGAKGTENAKELYKLALKRFTTQKEMNEELGKEAVQSLINASTQERMAEMIEKIKQSIVDFVEKTNIIEKIENFVKYISSPENIKKILNTIKNIVTSAISIMADISSGILRVFNFISFDKFDLDDIADKIQKNSKQMIKNINSIDLSAKEENKEIGSTIEKAKEKQEGVSSGAWKGGAGIPEEGMSTAKIENPLSLERNKLALESSNNNKIDALRGVIQDLANNSMGAVAKNNVVPVVLEIKNNISSYEMSRGMKLGWDIDVTSADNRTPPYDTTTLNFV